MISIITELKFYYNAMTSFYKYIRIARKRYLELHVGDEDIEEIRIYNNYKNQ